MTIQDVASDEAWRPVVGFEGHYSVSDQGRVRSHKKGRELILRHGGARVPMVILCCGGARTGHSVHKLVLDAFVGPRPDGHECRHLNGNEKDNRLTNLIWGTHTQNMRDRDAHGTQNWGEKHGMSRYTEDLIRAVRAASGTQQSIADTFGLRPSFVSKIRLRTRWKHVT